MYNAIRHSRPGGRARVLGSLAIAGLLGLALTMPSTSDSLATGTSGDPGRYTMQPTEGGVLRLDRETGAMSFCSGKEGNWSCQEMPEAQSDLRRKVEQLEGEKRALEAERRLREGLLKPAPDTVPPEGDTLPPAPPGDLPIPNERDVDKLFDYVEGMVRKFKERIDRLEKEAKRDPEIPL